MKLRLVFFNGFADIKLSNGECTLIFQQITLSGNSSTRLDTENAKCFELNIDGQTIYGATKNSCNSFIWENGDYVFTLGCPESMPLEEVEKIISGLEKQALPNN